MRRWAIMKRLITPREPITRGNRDKYGTLTWQQDREIVEQEAKAYCRAKWRKAKEKLPQPEPLISKRVHAEIEELIQGMPDCEPGCDDRGQDHTAKDHPRERRSLGLRDRFNCEAGPEHLLETVSRFVGADGSH